MDPFIDKWIKYGSIFIFMDPFIYSDRLIITAYFTNIITGSIVSVFLCFFILLDPLLYKCF